MSFRHICRVCQLTLCSQQLATQDNTRCRGNILHQRDQSQSVQTEANRNSPVNTEEKTTLKPTWETLSSSDEKAADITNVCPGDADQVWEEGERLPYRVDGPGT